MKPGEDQFERRACQAPGQHRSTKRKMPRGRDDEAALTADLVALAEKYARARGRHLAGRGERLSAVRSPRHRHTTDDALTSNFGHRMGGGHTAQGATGMR